MQSDVAVFTWYQRPFAPIRKLFRKQERADTSIIEDKYAATLDSAVWASFWLSKSIILLFVTLFISLTAALLVLRHFNTLNHGFGLITTNHYAYTYRPTAVLVFIVAMWRQVEHHCKTLAPWESLRRAKGSSRTTIALDYVSPLQIVSLFSSLRNRDWAVVLAILSFVILKLITIASTGLFSLETRARTDSISTLSTATTFNGSLYNATEYLGVMDSSLFYTAYAEMVKGLPSSEGTTGEVAYQRLSFEDVHNDTNTTLTAVVDMFVPSFNCEEAQISLKLQPDNTSELHPKTEINIISPNCKLLAGSVPIYTLNPHLYACPTQQLSGLMQRVDCSGQPSDTPVGNWQLLTVADMRYSQTVSTSSDTTKSGASFNASSWSTTIANVSAIVCKSTYTIQKRPLTYHHGGERTQISLGVENFTQGQTLQHFADEDLGVMFTSAYIAAALMFGNKADSDVAEEYPDTMFQTMADVSGGTYEMLLDQKVMMFAAEKVFNHVAVQIASNNLIQEQVNTLNGTISHTEQKLFIRELPLWLTVAGFTSLAVLTTLLWICRPRDPIPFDPEPVSTMAVVLSASPAFEQVMKGGDSVGQVQLLQQLDSYQYRTEATVDLYGQQKFAIHVDGVNTSQDVMSTTTEDWWRPLLLRPALVAVILALPVAVFVVLEVLQHLSGRPGGIASLPKASGIGTEVSTRFLPSLVMLLISTTFNAVDFNRAALAPYETLKTERQLLPGSVFISFLGKTPPEAIWAALMGKHWNILLSSIASLLGSLLTVIVSGLLIIDSEPRRSGSSVLLQDSFSTIWNNSVANDSSAAVVSSLIEAANLSYPSFTYDQLAFPRLLQNYTVSQNAGSDDLLFVQLPALRGSLSCDVLSKERYNVSESYNSRILSAGVSVEASIPLPADCLFGGEGGNLSTLDFQYSIQFPSGSNSSFVGKMLDIHVGPYSGPFAGAAGELFPYTQPDNPPGCPSLAFIYGYADVEDTSKTTMSVLSCSQVIEQLEANVTMQAVDLSISSLTPPVANESTAIALPSSSGAPTNTSATAFPFRLQVHMDQALSMFNQTEYSSSSLTSQPVVDNFFQAVIFGRTPVPQDLMRATDAASQKRIHQAIQNFYRRYMAQAISANMRTSLTASSTEPIVSGSSSSDNIESRSAIPFSVGRSQTLAAATQPPPAPAPPSAITATLQTSQAKILHMNETSKIVLQVLLGIMALCGMGSSLLSPRRHTLLHNPCTIAGLATLVAGSRLVKNLAAAAPGAAVPEEKQRLLRESKLRLGWWWDQSSHDNTDTETAAQSDGKLGVKRYGIDLVD